MVKGTRLIITGVATASSIAWKTAEAAHRDGAQLLLAAFPRDLDAARALAATLDPAIAVVPCDLTDPADLEGLEAATLEHLGGADGALHAVAFAPRAALGGPFAELPADAVGPMMQTSVVSFAALARCLAACAQGPASLVGLDFDAGDRAWPVYNWMGVAKAALRSSARYLARDFGPSGMRVNLVAAGPLGTRAASAIPGFERLLEAWERTAPLPWDPDDASSVADACCFLLSRASRGISGEVLHVDGGFHAMATTLR